MLDFIKGKRKFLHKTLFLHKWIAKRFGYAVEFVHQKCTIAGRMSYDATRLPALDFYEGSYAFAIEGEKDNFLDYVRYRAAELVFDRILGQDGGGAVVTGSVAELGVLLGSFAYLINHRFPDRKLFLYDTFEGFDARDVDHDSKNAFSKSKVGDFSAPSCIPDPIEYIRSRMPFLNQCVFRKGYFPETAAPDSDEKFAFVSIDTDLYKPIRAGLEFFYPRLTKGGYIFVHDYNDGHWLGAKKAVSDVEEILGPLNKFPLPDWGGTLVIAKT